MFDDFFSFEGRLRRSDYFFGQMKAWLANFFIVNIPTYILVRIDPYGNCPAAWSIISYIIWGLINVHIWSLNARRCHDIGRSGWFQLIPFYCLYLLFPAGQRGPNKYGEDPKAEE